MVAVGTLARLGSSDTDSPTELIAPASVVMVRVTVRDIWYKPMQRFSRVRVYDAGTTVAQMFDQLRAEPDMPPLRPRLRVNKRKLSSTSPQVLQNHDVVVVDDP